MNLKPAFCWSNQLICIVWKRTVRKSKILSLPPALPVTSSISLYYEKKINDCAKDLHYLYTGRFFKGPCWVLCLLFRDNLYWFGRFNPPRAVRDFLIDLVMNCGRTLYCCVHVLLQFVLFQIRPSFVLVYMYVHKSTVNV